MSDTVRVRVAPSPTGDPHVGTAYVSLFNVAFARKHGGSFVLRIEDTDRARFEADSEQQIFDTLHWLGLDWDEGPDKGGPYAPYRQSERLDSYRPVAERLLAEGRAYHCWCTPERLAEMRQAQQKAKQPTGYDRLCLGKTRDERAALPGFSETPVVRMLIPDHPPLQFTDLVRGEVNAPRPDDQVLLKADGFPTYHLANVVDDHEMAITHVVRGEEWVASTPKHILLYDWLGWERPAFAHMPLLRNVDKSKISKRKNPAARLHWFVEEGFLPEALRNFLALMGYSMPDGRELFGLDEMVESFDWARVNPVGPVFDVDKLRWMSGHYLRELPVADAAERLVGFMQVSAETADLVRRATPLVQERVSTLREAAEMLDFLVGESFDVDPAAAAKQLGVTAEPVLLAAATALGELTSFGAAEVEAALRAALVDGLGLKPKHAFGPVRVAVTGRTVSPPLFESIELLGREVTLERLQAALGAGALG
ncbi:MAG TPA: glutamate--tRNA ligase [Mycobacteriales bacterium]|nr:glutamate--tRNA ligase [Mycobacteriales bacterium]